jgi:predicted dehydrogenase
LLRNFLSHPQARVVAVIDPSADRLNTLARQFDLGEQMLLSTDWEAVLLDPNLEAAVIATPAVTHYALIRSALQHHCHVLAEKPLTLNVAECHELCQLAAQQQRQLVVDHTYLFHPAVQQGQILLRQKQLGELRYGYAARTHLGPIRQDVDALWDLAIHDIAIFNHWLNETPSQVQAQGTTWLPHLPPPILHPHSSSGLSDLVWVTLTYPSGFQAFIHLCWSNADKQRRLSVVGSQGTLVFDELATAPLTLLPGRLEHHHNQFIPINQPQQVVEVNPIEPLQSVCTHFLTCAQQNTPSWISPGWLGANLVETLVALTRSLHEGGRIVAVTCDL